MPRRPAAKRSFPASASRGRSVTSGAKPRVRSKSANRSKAAVSKPTSRAKKTVTAGGSPRPKPALPMRAAARTKASLAPRPSSARPASSELTAMLEARRREIREELAARIRDVRETSTVTERPVLADEGLVPSDVDGDIELHLVQMRAESLKQVEAALSRVALGTHGKCHECGQPISPARLRAVPFAIRCTDCEAHRESLARPRPIR